MIDTPLIKARKDFNNAKKSATPAVIEPESVDVKTQDEPEIKKFVAGQIYSCRDGYDARGNNEYCYFKIIKRTAKTATLVRFFPWESKDKREHEEKITRKISIDRPLEYEPNQQQREAIRVNSIYSFNANEVYTPDAPKKEITITTEEETPAETPAPVKKSITKKYESDEDASESAELAIKDLTKVDTPEEMREILNNLTHRDIEYVAIKENINFSCPPAHKRSKQNLIDSIINTITNRNKRIDAGEELIIMHGVKLTPLVTARYVRNNNSEFVKKINLSYIRAMGMACGLDPHESFRILLEIYEIDAPYLDEEYYSDISGDNSHPEQDIPEEREPEELKQLTAEEAKQRLEELKSEWAEMAECDSEIKNSWVESHRKEVDHINKIIRQAQEVERKKREQEKLLQEAEQGLPPRDRGGRVIYNLINPGDPDYSWNSASYGAINLSYVQLCKSRRQLRKLLNTGLTQTLRDITTRMYMTSYKGPRLSHRKIYHDDKNGIINRLLDTFFPEDTTPEDPRPETAPQPEPKTEAAPAQEAENVTQPESEHKINSFVVGKKYIETHYLVYSHKRQVFIV